MLLSETVTDANVKQYAIERLAKLLRHPDDLVYKADDVRRKLAQEKLLIDAQLSTDVRRQFDDVQEGIELLYTTKGQIGRVKTDMQQVDHLCNQAQSYLTNFDRIQKISIANRNFVRVNEFYRQFSEFHEQYTLVRQMLADAQTNFEQADFNLLRLHYFLYKLEDFRNRALGFSGVNDADSVQTLLQMFGGLDSLVASSRPFFGMLPEASTTWPCLLKVIEVEEAADRAQERETEGAGLARRQSLISGSDRLSMDSSNMGRGPKKERRIKKYKQKLLDLMHDFIFKRVSDFVKQDADGLDGITEVTGFIVDELTFVAEAVAPAFPPNYFIFDEFVNEYHQAVVATTNELISGDLEGGSILMLLRWVREYYTAMRKELSIQKDRLKPALLEGREDQLAQEYLDIAVRKIREWITNLMRSEAETFTSRVDAPSMGEDGLYVTNGSVFLFEIVNQNLDVVIQAQRAKLLCDLREAKQIETPENVAEGLVDYTMALANEQIRSVVQAETIRDEPATGFRARTRSVQGGALADHGHLHERSRGGHADPGRHCVLRPAANHIGAVHADWYQDDLLQPVIETLKDYCQDFQDHLDNYIDAVAGKVKFYKGQTSEKLTLELHRATKFFKQHMDGSAVAETLNVVRILISLIDSTPTMIFLEFFSVKKQYPDLPLALVEDILTKRDDLEKQQLKSILESLRQKSKGDTGSSLAKQRTLFSKLKSYPPLGSVAQNRFF
ncbi:exocyst complex component Sec6-domain-containing protein [Kickxella alabastrina]|uniref:exocyst complex component Sec6-domain-containing protein n=1 Tax=Kickxella alabastrina TaxID=61397 RepID=UPI00221EF074|nr:exocyst complex component Sec6-domain-containing protein [Kickxella alabastrina]KAI7825605.1 exocyst complex component Sec6-domain-containing protein [Kickxella alabastrina]